MDRMREQDLHAVELERVQDQVDGPKNVETQVASEEQDMENFSEHSVGSSCFEETVAEINSKIVAQKLEKFNNMSWKLGPFGDQGAVSIRKTVLPGMAIPMLKIRRPNGRLIFNMEIAIRR